MAMQVSQSLRGRLILLAVLLALVPVTVSDLVLGYLAQEALHDDGLRRMNALAAGKAELVEMIVSGWVRDANQFGSAPRVRQLVAQLGEGADDADLQERLADQLPLAFGPEAGEPGLVAILALPTGEPLAWSGYTSKGTAARALVGYSPAFLAAQQAVWISPVQRGASGQPVVDVVRAIYPGETASGPSAALVWRISLTNRVVPYIEPYSEMGSTGELILVNQQGLVLNELRHQPGATMRQTVDLAQFEPESDEQEYTFHGWDYRGVWVLLAYRQVPMTGWGVIAKMDAQEAYAASTRWGWTWLALMLVVLLVALIVANQAGRSLARPIVGMADAARKVAEGDLTIRLPVQREDELGNLARIFNEMVQEVATHRGDLEREVQERTRDLREATEELRASEVRLRRLSLRLSLAAEAERRKVAAQLHDTVVQQLGFGRMQIQLLRRQLPEEYRYHLSDLDKALEEAVRDSREIISETSPPVLYRGSLTDAVQQLGERFTERHGLTVEVHEETALGEVGETIRVLLFNCVRELLTNVVKHAETDRAQVLLAREGNEVIVTVADRGKGTETAEGDLSGGFGLYSIRERLREVGGSLQVEPNEPQGTRVTLRAPVQTAVESGEDLA